MADIRKAVAGDRGGYPPIERSPGHFYESQGLSRGIPHRNRDGGIAVIAVHHGPDINRNNVPFLKFPRTGYPVNDLIVD